MHLVNAAPLCNGTTQTEYDLLRPKQTMTQRSESTVQQNDPAEPLEVLDGRGHPTGHVKSRAEVHLAGDWHRAFHCWIIRPGPRGEEVVLQRRALTKDTFPGCWDASAAGHWRAGESPAEAAREVAEELGLVVPFERLAWRSRERIARHHPNGLVDREFHEVYVLEWPGSLTGYRPDPAEVIGLAACPLRELIGLVAGRRESTEATEAVEVRADGRLVASQAQITREGLVPYSAARLRRLLDRPGKSLLAARD